MQPLPAEQRRLQQRREARRAILDATEAVLVGEGFERLSMRRVAARCGYTVPTLYHHFGDKTGLIDELLEERFAKLLQRARRVRLSDDPVANMVEYASAFVRFGLQHPSHYRLMTTPRQQPSQPPPSAEETRALMERPILELAAAGRLYSNDVEACSQALWALLHGLISLRTSRLDHPWSKAQVKVAIESMTRGMIRPSRDGRKQRRRET
ncbi:MAG: TetR/AcrR family transcriptional regulator [Deltaproteobacteria bacterium]|nr:TetR/AcrR family transcriptional regulator [Deltaproteobacteria bacterium]